MSQSLVHVNPGDPNIRPLGAYLDEPKEKIEFRHKVSDAGQKKYEDFMVNFHL